MSAITLPVGASAEPDTCGSCKFFRRKREDYNQAQGFCEFVLPKRVAEQWSVRRLQDQVAKTDSDYTGNEDQIKDTDRCDLYRFSGQVYIVQRRIPPERT